MTIHLVFLSGVVVLARLTWHEPPPWTALPVKLSVLAEPTDIWLTGPLVTSALPVILHGKSAPAASNGELFGALKGVGVFMIM